MSKAPQLGKSLGKVSILGAESLLPFSKEGACAHVNVRFVVTLVRVRGKSILKHVWDVCACGSFFGLAMCDPIFKLFNSFQ